MLISRAPLRISIGGGGTDLPSFYGRHGGHFISAAIDKYIYVSVSRPFDDVILARYSESERVTKAKDLKHGIIRETLFDLSPEPDEPIEIVSIADIPSGTGLGSSGTFNVALMKALSSYYELDLSQAQIAERACKVEIERLGLPVGKQDQYVSSFGGLKSFTISRDGAVEVKSLGINQEIKSRLEDGLLLFYTGARRSSSLELSHQNNSTKNDDPEMIKNLQRTMELGYVAGDLIKSGKLNQFGLLMHEHWKNKLRRSSVTIEDSLKQAYDEALDNGAVGGKMVGAGGGGFFMFYAKEPNGVREVMKRRGLVEQRFSFDNVGATLVGV